MKPRFNAVFFDFDGTIVNSIADIVQAFNNTLEDIGLTRVEPESIRRIIGRPLHIMLQDLGYNVGHDQYQQFYRYYRRHYGYPRFLGEFFPKMHELIQNLYREQVTMAVITTKHQNHIEEVVDAYGLAKYFKILVGRHEDMKSKPAADQILFALNRLGLSAATNKICMIGDVEDDVLAAKAAGLTSISVAWGYRNVDQLKLVHPDFLAETPEQLISYLSE